MARSMSKYPSHRRSALSAAFLMLAVVLSGPVTLARSETITYNLLNYPANQVDEYGGQFPVTISGTITTDGWLGVYDSTNTQHITSIDLTYTTGAGFSREFRDPLSPYNGGNLFTATRDQITISIGQAFLLTGAAL